MIRVRTEIRDVYQSVRRPVIKDVITELAATLGIRRDIRVMYPGEDNPEDLPIRRRSETGHDEFSDEVKIFVAANIRYTDETLSDTSMHISENTPVFLDRRLGVALTPIYARTRIELDLTIEFRDKSAAMAQKARLRQLAGQQHKGMVHEISYAYDIPEYCLRLVEDVYILRENQAGYGESKSTYFSNHFSPKVTTTSTQDGRVVSFVVKETQNRVVGYYDFDVTPEPPEASQDGARHEMRLRYTFDYDEPLSMHIGYPMLIHNQLLPAYHYDMTQPYQLGLMPSDPGFTVAALDFFTGNNQVAKHYHGIPIPLNDQWIPRNLPPGMHGMVRILSMVDPKDRYFVMNLKDLGEVNIDMALLEYIKDARDSVIRPCQDLVYVGMWHHDGLLGHDNYYIDEDLNVYTKEPMDLRKTYRVLIAYYKSGHMLRKKTLMKAARHGVFIQKFLAEMNPQVEKLNLLPDSITPRTTRDSGARHTMMPQLRPDGSVLLDDLILAINYAAKVHPPYWRGGRKEEVVTVNIDKLE